MSKPKQNENRVATFVTDETLEQLKIEAQKRGLSVSGFIRTLILEELRKAKKNG